MLRPNPVTWWRGLLELPNTSRLKAIVIVLIVSVICAVVVSVTAVTLRPLQLANLEQAQRARMAAMLQSLPDLNQSDGKGGAATIKSVVVNLSKGVIAPDIDPRTFNQRAAAANRKTSVPVPDDADIAGITKRADHALVHFVFRDKNLDFVILPVRGAGYQSMLYGYLALQSDLNTIAGLTFYEQAETPGLGDRVRDPGWLAKWPGTRIVDEEGKLRIAVVQGNAQRPYEVDGISGATRTGNGVANLVRFWLGDFGFGPFLKRLAKRDVKP